MSNQEVPVFAVVEGKQPKGNKIWSGDQHTELDIGEQFKSVLTQQTTKDSDDPPCPSSKDTAKVSPIKPAQDGVQDRERLELDAMDVRPDIEAVVATLSASPPSLIGEGNEIRSAAGNTPDGIRSSPPALIKDVAMDLGPSNGPTEDVGVKSDSEAETIVLPGKDGHSPSKIRKSIKHEDKSEDEEMGDASAGGVGVGNSEVRERKEKLVGDGRVEHSLDETNTATSSLGKRKRAKHGLGVSKDDNPPHGNSSGLSSVPTSPVATTRSSLSKPAASESDSSRSPSPDSRSNSAVQTKSKSVDRLIPRRKTKHASGSGDEGESHGFKRQRSSGADQKQSKENRGSSTKATNTSVRKRTRSISPPSRGHRRSVSTQLPPKSTQGLSHKKKRVPAPLQPTEYQSDESSASGGSHPRSSRLRHLAAPQTGDSAISPAKMGSSGNQKKFVNPSGQTLIARACQSGKLELVKQRLEERPGDLNIADNASNTPLHTASLAGYDEIVECLLKAGCTVDPVNGMRDTPLHDAIDNSHLDVVRLLLDAGANPRKANGNGEYPYDLVDDESEVADELREAILAAKNRSTDRRFSEDEQTHDDTNDAAHSHPKTSSRDTPPTHDSLALAYTNKRNTTTRSVKTSDRHLYQSFDVEELRKAAAQNDTNTVVRILEVHNTNLDDAKSLVIAAKAGHHEVINMLFGFGEFNPDPEPLHSQPPESATPILAAIGRDNLEVINLFLNQSNFDPTKTVNGEKYYEIARRRAGNVWKEEETLLKNAYDKYGKTHKNTPKKPRSPTLRREGREPERDGRRFARKDESSVPRSHKRTTSSPKGKETENTKHGSTRTSQPKDAQRDTKKETERTRREDSYTSAITSDRETTPLGPPKQKVHPKRSESDVAATSETETASKPRRKLVSGREFRGERELERQRRPSVASTTSSASAKEKPEADRQDKPNQKTSASLSRMHSKMSNTSGKDHVPEMHNLDKEKSRSLKRDDSKDRLSAIRSESPSKRPRSSESTSRPGVQETTTSYDASGGPPKRRRIEGESRVGPKPDSMSRSSPDHIRTPSTTTSAPHGKPASKLNSEGKDKGARLLQKRIESPERSRQHHQGDEASKSVTSTNSGKPKATSKSETDEATQDIVTKESDIRLAKAERERESLREAEEQQEQARRDREQREAKERLEMEEKRREIERIDAAVQARLAREKQAHEEELKRQQLEQERKDQERKENAEAQIREQERQKALYLEQEEKRREDQERRRAQLLEQQRAERARIEKEKRLEKLEKLPLLLRWLEMEGDIRTPQYGAMFASFDGVRFDTIRPAATGQENAREQWMLSTNVALLLGEKDLQLGRYPGWERIPLSKPEKLAIWRTENGLYSLATSHPVGKVLSEKFPTSEKPYAVSQHCKDLFLDLDLFFVKVSEFLFVVPNFPHLRGLEMKVNYRELEINLTMGKPDRKFYHDPEFASYPFSPRPKYYINGAFSHQGGSLHSQLSRTSLGENRVPRRPGTFKIIQPDEPDYLQSVKEQGLYWLLPGYQPLSVSGADRSNEQANSATRITPPSSNKSKSVNGEGSHRGSLSEPADLSPQLPNGTHVVGEDTMDLRP